MRMGMVSSKLVEAQHEQFWFADRFDEQSKTNSFTSPRSAHLSTQQFRGGRLKVSNADFRIATWNVEGLTESKELQWHMRRHEIDILRTQETHQEHSSLRITDCGFLLVLSGFATSEPVETRWGGLFDFAFCSTVRSQFPTAFGTDGWA